jgi:DNA-binding NarL/FixJ family response regulator
MPPGGAPQGPALQAAARNPPVVRVPRRDAMTVPLHPAPGIQHTVLIACDQSLLRAGYRALLEVGPSIAVTGDAQCGQEAVELARQLRPDAVLMDLEISDCGCIEATSKICADPGVPVILLSALDDDERVFGALRAGATGVLSKDMAPDELVRGVEAATRGDAVLSPGLTRRLIAALVSRPEPTRPAGNLVSRLTSRERQVVTLVARGLSNDEIAEQLVVTSATARTHVSRAMVKLRARDRAQLVVFAYESELLTQPSQL